MKFGAPYVQTKLLGMRHRGQRFAEETRPFAYLFSAWWFDIIDVENFRGKLPWIMIPEDLPGGGWPASFPRWWFNDKAKGCSSPGPRNFRDDMWVVIGVCLA